MTEAGRHRAQALLAKAYQQWNEQYSQWVLGELDPQPRPNLDDFIVPLIAAALADAEARAAQLEQKIADYEARPWPGCRVLSKGDGCDCSLCKADAALAAAEARAAHAEREARAVQDERDYLRQAVKEHKARADRYWEACGGDDSVNWKASYEQACADADAYKQQAEARAAQLADAILPVDKRTDPAFWTTNHLASLAEAHRSDTELVDDLSAENTRECSEGIRELKARAAQLEAIVTGKVQLSPDREYHTSDCGCLPCTLERENARLRAALERLRDIVQQCRVDMDLRGENVHVRRTVMAMIRNEVELLLIEKARS